VYAFVYGAPAAPRLAFRSPPRAPFAGAGLRAQQPLGLQPAALAARDPMRMRRLSGGSGSAQLLDWAHAACWHELEVVVLARIY
jgi:hypothetical protein